MEKGLNFDLPEEIWVPHAIHTSVEQAQPRPGTTQIPIPSVTVSEPDEEGFVLYTIVSQYPATMEIDNWPESTGNYTAMPWVNDFDVYDYYTGRSIPPGGRIPPNYTTGDEYSVILEYDGNTVPVAYHTDYKLDYRYYVSSQTLVNHYDFTYKLFVRCPADYDGLMLGTDTVHPHDFEENAPDAEGFISLSDVLPECWNGDPSEWLFIRVSDLLAQQAAEAD